MTRRTAWSSFAAAPDWRRWPFDAASRPRTARIDHRSAVIDRHRTPDAASKGRRTWSSSRTERSHDEEEGWKAVGTFINVTFFASIIFCIFGVIFSPQLVSILGKAYSPEKLHNAIVLTRILFPSVGFLMLAGLTNGVLYSYKRFSSAAYGPAIYNLGAIITHFK